MRRAVAPWGGKLRVHPGVTSLKIQKADTESIVWNHYKYLWSFINSWKNETFKARLQKYKKNPDLGNVIVFANSTDQVPKQQYMPNKKPSGYIILYMMFFIDWRHKFSF